MVYKKIKDTIPSLSGLLLAGLMVGSSCKKDSPSTPAEQTNTGSNENKQKEPENKKSEGSEKAENQDFLVACSDFMKKILEGLGLDFLQKNPKPMILGDGDLNIVGGVKVKGDGQKVVTNLKKAASSFSAYPCYNNIKGLLADFALLDYHAGSTVAGAKGLVHKCAVGKSFNAIARPVNSLRDIYISLENQIDGKKSPQGFRKLAEEDLPNLVKKFLDENTTHLKENHPFYDTEDAKLLQGDQLVRFLTGKDDRGNDKPHSAADILERLNENVWIQNKTPEKACHEADDNFLDERGAGISAQWKVKDSSMPEIIRINNGQLDKSKECKVDFESLIKAEDKSKVDGLQEDAFFVTPDPRNQPNQDAVKQEGLTNAQLLFTLFKGDTHHDFLKIKKDNNKIELVSNNENFQQFKPFFEGNQKTDDDFAQRIGDHIATDIPGIFVIPNINKLKCLIWPGELQSNKSDSVNSGGNKDVGSDEFIGKQSVIKIVYTNIVKHFGMTDDGKLPKLLASVKKLGSLHGTDRMRDSDATIEQRVLVYVANELTKNEFLSNLNDINVADLEKKIVKLIEKITDFAIVRETGERNYQHTPITQAIRSFLQQFATEMEKKKGKASVNYAFLKEEINKARKDKKLKPEVTNFDIEEVRKVLVKDCDRLKEVLLFDLDDLLNRQADITKGDFPDYLSFVESDINELNAIKKKYKEKKASKANAPAA